MISGNILNNKKKVLFAITKGNFGGAQRYVFDLATSLPSEKYEVTVICGKGGLLIEKLKDLNVRAIEIEDLEREVQIGKDFKVLKKIISIIKKKRPDIIHLNSSKIGGVGAVAGRIASLFEKNYKPKIIFTAHNWGFNDKSRSAFEKLFYYISHWATVILCSKVIAVSEKTKKDISFLPFTKDKITIVYNGILEFETLPKEESRIIMAHKDLEKIILYSISELHKNKGIDIALKALTLLPKEVRDKIIYTVAGDGEERENLEILLKDYNLENNVLFLGFIPDAKKLLSGSDIFLIPSRTEAFPYSVLEAGVAELPIIATSVGGIPEVIRDMQNGILIHPHNPKEIAEAILYILDHPEKQKNFGVEIKKTVKNFFSLDKMISETIRIYN
jgi:glycosyltransferase involved in cell wall biosynthesis